MKSINFKKGLYDNFWQQYISGIWEPHTLNVCEKMLSPDNIFIDIGAWIGPVVLYGAKFCKKSYAIEPDPVAFAELLENIKLNPTLDIECHNIMIGDKNGKDFLLSYTQYGDSMSVIKGAPIHGDASSCIEVESLTLEAFLSGIPHEIKDIGLIKIDIEGSETVILKNAYDFIKQTTPNIYISLHPCWFGERDEFEANKETVLKFIDIYGGAHRVLSDDYKKFSITDINILLKPESAGLDLLLIK